MPSNSCSGHLKKQNNQTPQEMVCSLLLLIRNKIFGQMNTFRERFSKPVIANTMLVTGALASISTATIRRNESVSLLFFISCFSV